MIISQLDLGAPSHPFAQPVVGQDVASVVIEGYEPSVWSHGSRLRQQNVTFWVKAWQALGGQAAGTSGAMKYLLKQIEELASNRDQQPVYIQWTATADPAALLNATELHDGWYFIDDFEPDYQRNVVTGLVQCRMTVTQVAAAPPRSVAMAYTGGALSSNFSGTALNLVSLPVGSTAYESSLTRSGGEGSVPCILSPADSPEHFTLSGTISNWFKGGVHVYDTINTGSNPVPTSGGTFVNANWVEVFYTDHDFQGDCVITNGLQLVILTAGASTGILCYLWNTALATANWQQYATNVHVGSPGGGSTTLQQYTLVRVGPEECSVALTTTQSTNEVSRAVLRMQRGRFECRLDLAPLTAALSGTDTVMVNLVAVPKILYNSTKVCDNVLSETSPTTATDYGYGAAFVASTASPFIAGFLYQNQPGSNQPLSNGNSPLIGLGDTTSLAVNAQRSYGFFAVPYGVSGSYSTANLQAEGESGVLGTGWSSVVDAAASAGNAAKAASGTLASNADTFGTAWSPATGTYDAWFRIKVTSAASSSLEMTCGIWDPTAGAFVASGSTTLNRNAMGTSYTWVRVANGLTLPAAHATQFRAVTALTLTTDWFIDEAVLLPKQSQGVAQFFPQDTWQVWAYDRSTRLIRP